MVLPEGNGVDLHSGASFDVQISGAWLDSSTFAPSSPEVSLSVSSVYYKTHLGLLMRQVEACGYVAERISRLCSGEKEPVQPLSERACKMSPRSAKTGHGITEQRENVHYSDDKYHHKT
ncbi:hypothetical protein PoB_006702700 [Plakobranchus ocellatus]|uniref:Uncharacterized protein n=1 Tax=Plakobranchus ocellatus TaxID=259542 RepID=A0AAV4D8W2_9GAST|nr:hypothetical protein PoB_006702700 [Plakobranchus ocellatus]